ncbi:hypothetical protein P152DRAFT_395882 [Eremomyces bilateralis CBS 781.70]|uniref:Carrier domain-containing protein n=1 Tax=Eremomyces bilateralis CBS 781.70 TaxID=1392243 RepID=A0A6G1G4X2_9PEZI|nr:uncharacterized protein P152DRAFT_395882 [Eremomyces bilateralis CBS 781.70]KAF1813068.1 hypothetical protein P152DRAFT_395882 [Eremomyces bilateralis CBS 781.70]
MDASRDLRLSQLNPVPERQDGPELLHDLIRNTASTQTALDFIDSEAGRRVLSYQDLQYASDILAARIVRVCKDTRSEIQQIIPVLIPQSPELYISLLAILKAGCAFCPLQLDAPEERLRFVISDTSAPAVVTTESQRKRLDGIQGARIISFSYSDLSSQARVDFNPVIHGSDLAYIMYTSGSTGTPKGVAVSHFAVTQSLLSHDRELPHFSRFLQFASPTFDVCIFEIFFTWFRGATLVSCSREILIDDLPTMMRQLDVDAAELTPTVAGNLLKQRSTVPSLRLLLTIGEKLTGRVVVEFGGTETEPSILWALYGPTECAIHCAIQPAFNSRLKAGLLGRTFSCGSAYVVSPREDGSHCQVEILPVGYVGELAIGGYQLAREYLNREEQTAKAFVDTENIGRLYRTGDQVRMLPSGALEYIGRLDTSQVKLRGQRVELGEVEHAISKFAGCDTAVASIVSGSLVVFCRFTNQVSVPSPEAIVQYSKTWLPSFMVPGSVEIIDEIPYLPSGKINRKLLESQFLQKRASVLNGEVEKSYEITTASGISKVLERILQVRLAPDTPLASSGLDSLRAISAASALRDEGFNLSATALLSCSTVEDLIEHIQGRTVANETEPKREIPSLGLDQVHPDAAGRMAKDEILKIIPCTPLQLSMLAEMEKSGRAYRNWVQIEIPGTFSAHTVTNAFEHLVASNEILRTGFALGTTESMPYLQVIRKSLPGDTCVEVDTFENFDKNTEASREMNIASPLHILIERNSNPTKVLIHMSHLIYDGWSMDLMLDDLYGYIHRKSILQRPQFSSVVDFTMRPVEKTTRMKSERFWVQQLKDYPFIPLPLLNAVSVQHKLKTIATVMEGSLHGVREAAANLNVSPQVLFQAALAHLIGLYKGVDDVCLASVTSGRMIPVPGIENILGPCIATLPLRLLTNDSTPAATLMRKIHQLNTDILAHSYLSLSEIRRLAGFNPGEMITDVLFVWQESLSSTKVTPSSIRIVDSFDYTEFALNFEVEPQDSNILLKATFDEAIIDAAHIHVLMRQIETFVSCACENPQLRFADYHPRLSSDLLSLIPIREQTPPSEALTDRISRWARDYPDRTALWFTSAFEDNISTIQITYADLEDRANRLAHAICALRESSDVLACIYMDKSVEFYVAVLAIVRAGLGYLPITPDTPQERIETILHDSQVRIHIVSDATSELLELSGDKVLLNVESLDVRDFSSQSLQHVPLSSPAYAVYTSGSTGLPKGVLVSQGNLLGNLEILSSIYAVSAGSRLLQACSIAFDVSVFEIFFCWYSGMTLCSSPKDALFRDLEHAIRTFQITHLSMTPTVAALVDPANVPSVQFLVTAGEALTEVVKSRWTGKGLFQGYGPCETTNICTVKEDVKDSDVINNIGPPFKNTSVFVSGVRGFEILPRGSIGELCFGGSQVCMGYLNNPNLTSEKFLVHPTFGRLYRSGDLGRLLPDGQLLFAGRSDDQVKIRGQRVELGEINHILCSTDIVQDCCSLVIGSSARGNILVTFWVPVIAQSEPSVVSNLTKFGDDLCQLFDVCARRLAAYMIPTHLIPIGRIPQTRQGKADRRALKAEFEALDAVYLNGVSVGSSSDGDMTDWTEEEHTIASVLGEVLQVPRREIQKTSSFFGLGLDSISAITVSRRLELLNIQATVSQLLRFPTIASLSRGRSSDEPSRTKVDLSNIWTKSDLSDLRALFRNNNLSAARILPCTALQEAMMSTSSTSPDAYCNVMRFSIHEDSSKVIHAWDTVLRRHDIFRTAFASTQNRDYPFAQILLDGYLPRTHHVHVASEEDLDEVIGHQKTTVQDKVATIQPPYVSSVAEFVDGAIQIIFCCHHALYDGEAMSLLVKEVQQLCKGEHLSALPIIDPFLNEVILSRTAEADSFWAQLLQNARSTIFPPLSINPTKRERPKHLFETYGSTLAVSLTRIDSAIRTLNTPLLCILQAAWAKVLAQCVGQSTICFGNVVSGRSVPVPGVERLVAPCFNTVPIHIQIKESQSNLELVESLCRFTADAMPYQLYPLRRVLSNVQSINKPLFDSLFLLQPGPYRLDEHIWTLEEDSGWMDFPLVAEITPDRHQNVLGFKLHFSTSKLEYNDAVSVATLFSSALETLLDSPNGSAIDHGPSFLDERLLAGDRTMVNQGVVNSGCLPNTVDTKEREVSSKSISQLELKILEHMARFTGKDVSQISGSTTIFQLGVDSISAVQLASLLRREGLHVSSLKILELQTASAIAKFLELKNEPTQSPQFDFAAFDRQHRARICEELNISSSEVEKLRPCTPLQSGIIAQFLQSNGDRYLNQYSIRLRNNISENDLQGAWEQVQSSHEMLRTGFFHLGGTDFPFAMITYTDGAGTSPWSQEPLTHSEQDKLQCVSQDGSYFAQNLHIPGWRLLLERGPGSTTLHIAILHALYDANSIAMILEDVSLHVDGKPVSMRSSIEKTLGAILQQPDVTEAKSFWTKQDLRVTKFPNLCPYQTSGSLRVMEINCSTTLTGLAEACKASDVTMQAMGQVAWARVLGAYTGEDRVTFGVVLSGRNTEESRTAPFPTFTTVPISVAIDTEAIQSLLEAVAFNSQVLKYQHVALSDIKSWAGLDDRQLFDSLFVFQQSTGPETRLDFGEIVHEAATSEFVVSVELLPKDDDVLVLRLTFQSNMLPEPQAQTLLEQMDHLLASFSKPGYEDQALSPLLYSITPARDSKIDSDETLLHHFVENQLEPRPQVVALQFASDITNGKVRSHCWSYKELDNAANRVANIVLDSNVQQGSLVAICFNKCPEASFAIVGILKSGCAYVALDPSAPLARKSFILQDSQASLILTTKDLRDELSPLPGVRIIALEDGECEDFEASSPRLSRPIEPSDVAYCLYTSGTTGTPKGCEITHDNAVQAIKSFQRIFSGHWNDDSRWLQFASFHFDVSVLELFWSWSVGIRVVSAPKDVIFEDLAGAIRSLRITHIDLTPSLARLIRPEEVPSLCDGVFITGGEQLRQDVLDAWGSAQVIYNGYGPTEATIGVTMLPRVPSNGKPSNIGPQFDNVGTFVFKKGTDTPVLRGGVGELCVHGVLVGKGYLNRPELTDQKFPYLRKYGVRVYRTGDLVRILHDGSFDFLGRQDDQVKLRGQRLEISEINSVIVHDVPEIRDVATLVLKHPQMQREQLVSFIVRHLTTVEEERTYRGSGTSFQSVGDKARSSCQKFLSPYMVPTYFVHLDALPLSVNNKLDENRLKEHFYALSSHELQGLGRSTSEDNRMTVQESQLANILREMLRNRIDTISPSSNIFELGLDSISVIELAKRIRQANLGRPSIQALMQLQTVRDISSTMVKDQSSKASSRATAISAKQLMSICKHKHLRLVASALSCESSLVESIAPCTPLQEGMIATTMNSSEPFYFAQFRFELHEGTDIPRLRAAWQNAQHNLQMLRTSFVQSSSGYVQAVMKYREFPWKGTFIPEATLHQGMREMFQDWYRDTLWTLLHPFELVLVKSEARVLLSLHMFHGLYDGISMRLLLQSIAQAYQSEPNVQYGPNFHEVLPFGPLATLSGAEQFWLSHLAGRKSGTHPQMRYDCPSPLKVSSTLGGMGSIERLRKSLKVTTQAVVQAAWAVTMNKELHRPSPLVLGLVISGRSIDFNGADKVVGPLFNTIPFCLELRSNDTWRDLIARCQSFNIAVLPFQHTPLRNIHKWNQVPSNHSLFDTLLVFQQALEGDSSNENLWEQTGEGAAAHYPLSLDIELIKESMKLEFVSQGWYCDGEQLSRLLSEFQQSMEAMLLNVDDNIGYFTADGDRGSPIASETPSETFANGHVTKPVSVKAELLRDLVGQLTGIDLDDISYDGSMVGLGLDSIDAIRLSSQIRQAGYSIPVGEIMRSKSIAAIAEQLVPETESEAEGKGDKSMDVLLPRLNELVRGQHPHRSIQAVYPATPLQEGMLVHMMSSGFKRYFNHEVLQLSSHTKLNTLQKAWDDVIRTTEALQISFMELDDPSIPYSFAQVVVQEKASLQWFTKRLDDDRNWLSAVEDAKRQAERNAEQGELISLCTIETPDRTLLTLSLSHALYDGWSIGLLHSDVQEAYHGRLTPRPPIGPTIQTILKGDSEQSQIFWRDYLSECQPTHTSLRTTHPEKSGVLRRESVSDLSVQTIKGFCKSAGVTMQTLTHTCMAMVLASRSASLETVHGLVLSGRDNSRSSEVMFPTMATVPLRTFIHGDVRSMLGYMHENIADVVPHQHYPLRKIQTLVERNSQPLFDALFIYQAHPQHHVDEHEKLYETIDGDAEVEFGVAAEAEIADQTLVWRVACSESRFDTKAVQQFLRELDSVLRYMVNFPDRECLSADSEGITICGLSKFALDAELEDRGAGSDGRDQARVVDEATWTELELSIRQVLSNVAGIPEDDVTKDSTLPSIGLDSISAIKVSKLLRNRGILLPVSTLLRASTVRTMAQVPSQPPDPEEADKQSNKATWKSHAVGFELLESVDPGDVEMAIPATAGQVYMLSVWQNSNGRLFWPTFEYTAPGTWSRAQIEMAWNALVQEHPILRTTFVATETELPIMQVVLRGDSKTLKERKIVNLTIEEKVGTWVLRLNIHHALYDAISLPRLIQRLDALCLDSNLSSSDWDNSFGEYVNAVCDVDSHEQARSFWSSYLHKAPNPLIKPSSSSSHRRVELFKADVVNQTALLEKKARASHVSVHHIFLAAYAQAYARLVASHAAHSKEVVFGVYLANRSHDIPGLVESCGPTLNLVPLRVSLNANKGLVEMARKIQDDLLEMNRIDRAGAGLWQIERWTGIQVDSFVNFLKLLDIAEVVGAGAIRAADGERDGYARVVEGKSADDGEGLTKLLEKNRVRGAYLPSVDVEARIVDGGLQVGVFCPEGLLTLSEAGKLVDDLRSSLLGSE